MLTIGWIPMIGYPVAGGFLCTLHTQPDSLCELCELPIPLPDSSVSSAQNFSSYHGHGYTLEEIPDRAFGFV